MKSTKKILDYLSKNPLLSAREISDNTLNVQINYNIISKILHELISQNKILKLQKYYYVIPSINDEIQFLIQITDSRRILKPKFKNTVFPTNESEQPNFQLVLDQYVSLVNLEFKTKLAIWASGKTSLDEYGENELKNYLRSYKPRKNLSNEEFHSNLSMYIEKRYDSNKITYDEIITRSRSLKEKLRMLSTWLKVQNYGEIADQHSYNTNKIPRKIIQEFYHSPDNYKKLALEKIWLAEKTGKITNEMASQIFVQWILRLNQPHLKTKEAQRKFSKNIKKRFHGWDIFEQGDFTSFDIS